MSLMEFKPVSSLCNWVQCWWTVNLVSKRKQIESVLNTQEQLQTAFGDLSNQALDNQKKIS